MKTTKDAVMERTPVPPVTFEHADPILCVEDLQRSIRYYADVLLRFGSDPASDLDGRPR